MNEGDKWKPVFRTSYVLFENTIMPFELANAPNTIQNMMNEVFREFVDQGVVVYLNNILIYSSSQHK